MGDLRGMRYPTSRASPHRGCALGGALLTLLSAAAALAQTPLSTWVTGVGTARSVVVLTSGGDAALCRDDGQVGDPVAGDGVWACPPLAHDLARDALAVMLDGQQLVRAQAVDPGLGAEATLAVEGDRLVVRPGAPPAGVAGEPRPPLPALVIDVDRGESRQAWILEVSAATGGGQLACHDDGDFPDAARNDDVPVCAGPGAAGSLTLRLRTPSQEDTATLDVGPARAVVQGRWTAEGLQTEARPLLATLSSTAQALPGGDALPAPRGGESGGGGPAVKPPDAPEHTALWAGLLALLAGLVGWRIGRGPRPDRALHGSLERAESGPVLEELASFEEAWRWLGDAAPVVVVGSPEGEPPPRSGAVLRCRSTDVLDVVDAVRDLVRRDPLRAVGLLVAGPDLLQSPGGLGVRPHEVLARELPAGARCVVVHAPVT